MKKINTENAPAAIGPYSQAITAGEMIYVSGQLGLDPKTGKLVEGEIAAETKQALENIKAVLLAAGSSLAKVVSANVYLADMNEFSKINEIYAGYFAEPYPARATVAVKTLPKNGRVEIAVIAAR
ncbi:MAG: RidA family protein [Planctomycetes bacterium]|nr:RidA family protein [Planctomycetota bacterium]MBU1518685.1 RidA family protein [Planctomycetota bacterium]MBU2457917.1 RidA family protein [Planctomycetota bacterium]MBU2596731.1 RidA family protein [Planctomycetota bacterium]